MEHKNVFYTFTKTNMYISYMHAHRAFEELLQSGEKRKIFQGGPDAINAAEVATASEANQAAVDPAQAKIDGVRQNWDATEIPNSTKNFLAAINNNNEKEVHNMLIPPNTLDINDTSPDLLGRTPLQIAIERGLSPALIGQMMLVGADPKIKGNDGMSATDLVASALKNFPNDPRMKGFLPYYQKVDELLKKAKA